MKENIFNTGYVNENYLKEIGIKSVGKNVLVQKSCTIVGIENITIGSNVRIDGFNSLIAPNEVGLSIGSFVHIGAQCVISSNYGIEISDFVGLSHGVKIFSGTDDYTGEALTNPTVPSAFTKIYKGKVKLSKHVVVGSGSVILPNLTIGIGSSIGALSLVNHSIGSWGVYFGSPVKKLKERSKNLLELEKRFLSYKE